MSQISADPLIRCFESGSQGLRKMSRQPISFAHGIHEKVYSSAKAMAAQVVYRLRTETDFEVAVSTVE